MLAVGCRTWHVASLPLLLHSTPPGQSSQSKPGAMWGAGEARWGEQRALATNGPGCGSQWELAPLQSPPWVGALPGKAGSLCNMQTHCGSSTAPGFAQRQVTGSPALKRKLDGSHTHRESLPQEPHVGDPVVDLRQHVLQILGGDPGSERGETCSGALGWKGLPLGLGRTERPCPKGHQL